MQIRVAVNAFADRDCPWASALADMDEAMDELERSLFRTCLGRRAPATTARVVRAVQLALVARHYERIGDHAVTIAEQVPFVVTGEPDGGVGAAELDVQANQTTRRECGGCGARDGGSSRPHTSGVALSATHGTRWRTVPSGRPSTS